MMIMVIVMAVAFMQHLLNEIMRSPGRRCAILKWGASCGGIGCVHLPPSIGGATNTRTSRTSPRTTPIHRFLLSSG